MVWVMLDDVPMRDYKSMLEREMAYGPEVKGPVDLKYLCNEWNGAFSSSLLSVSLY